jgi:hypothetical protein
LPNTPIFDEIFHAAGTESPESTDVRFNSGAFGKRQQNVANNSLDSGSCDFETMPSDHVPSRAELDEIWFWMNFKLNFARLASVTNPVKIMQHLKYLKNITEVIAPDDPFPLYFYGYLNLRAFGNLEQGIVIRLEKMLAASAYWRERFAAFDLSTDHLRARDIAGTTQPTMAAY